jgi:biopolymer transport protein ExbD
MFRKLFFILVLFTACETSNYLVTIEVSEGRKIIVNDIVTEVEELGNNILYIAQEKKLDFNQIKNSKVKVEFSSKATVGMINDIKRELTKIGIQQIDFYTMDESKDQRKWSKI